MKTIALIIDLFIAVLGALGSISPDRLFLLAREFQNKPGLLVAALLRLILGTALFSSAPASRLPGTMRLFGGMSFLSGLGTPWIGVEGFSRILKWWYGKGPVFMRVWSLSVLAFGILMAWALTFPHEKSEG